jgi:hypothetical protein
MPTSSREQDSAENLRSMQTAMERLERRDWWRWATALIIMLLLTLGVLALSVAGGPQKELVTQYRFELAVPGLFALVLLFDIFAIYQQILISRLRRQLSGQIGMLATLEALKPQALEDRNGWKERRRVQRTPLDQRLKVIATTNGKETILLGRVIDISELGLAAVLSGSLERGDKVLVEFSPGGDQVMTLSAVIRNAQGFRHGFEFSNVRSVDLEQLRRVCTGATYLNVRRVEARATSVGSE